VASNISKFSGNKSKKQPENSEMDNPERVRIRPKYNATIAFSLQEDKNGTKETILTNLRRKRLDIIKIASDSNFHKVNSLAVIAIYYLPLQVVR